MFGSRAEILLHVSLALLAREAGNSDEPTIGSLREIKRQAEVITDLIIADPEYPTP